MVARIKKHYTFVPFLIVSLIIISGCSYTVPITERPCEQNIVVINDKNTGKISIISGSVIIIDNDDKPDMSLTIYFQELQNKYWLSFMHYSYGGSSCELEYVYLKFIDGTDIKLENPKCEKEMDDGEFNKYTNSYFEINDSDIKKLSGKDIKQFRSLLRSVNHQPILVELNADKATTIKYLAKCFAETALKIIK